MSPLILELLRVLAPVIIEAIKHWRSDTGAGPTDLPTVDEWRTYLRAQRQIEIDKIIAEGEAWKAAHPPGS